MSMQPTASRYRLLRVASGAERCVRNRQKPFVRDWALAFLAKPVRPLCDSCQCAFHSIQHSLLAVDQPFNEVPQRARDLRSPRGAAGAAGVSGPGWWCADVNVQCGIQEEIHLTPELRSQGKKQLPVHFLVLAVHGFTPQQTVSTYSCLVPQAKSQRSRLRDQGRMSVNRPEGPGGTRA